MTQLVKRGHNGNSLFPSLRNDFLTNRFFDGLFDFDSDLFNTGSSIPPVNISETKGTFIVDLSVPGMAKEDFKVDIEDNILTVSSKRKEEKTENDKNFKRCEFSYSSFSRSFTLPENVDENNISAKYNNGVLKLTIPKKEVTVSKSKKEISVS